MHAAPLSPPPTHPCMPIMPMQLWAASDAAEDQAKLAVARALLAQIAAKAPTRPGLRPDAAAQAVDAALGDAWGSQRARLEQGLPSLKEVLVADPCFVFDPHSNNPGALVAVRAASLCLCWERGRGSNMREGGWRLRLAVLRDRALDCAPVSPLLHTATCQPPQPTHRTPQQLDLKQLIEAASAEGGGEHPAAPGAKALDPSFWTALPRRPGQPACGLHARLGWCVHRAGCPFDHDPEAPKAVQRRADVEARVQSGAVRIAARGATDGAAAPVRPNERDWCVVGAFF